MNWSRVLKWRYSDIASYSFLILLLVWAVVYAKARILISDPAFYFFNIVNDADYFVPHTRTTAIITQVPLVWAAKMHLPLAMLLNIYSVSFVLVRVVYFFLVNNVLKNKAAGFAVIAVSSIGIVESYFRPTSESNLALLNSILLYAWLVFIDSKKLKKIPEMILGIGGTIVLVFFGYVSHSIALFSLLFVLFYFSFEYRKFKTPFPYVTVVFTLLVFMYHVFFGSKDTGHNNLYGNLLVSPFTILDELNTYYPYKFFFRHINAIFIPYLVMLVVSVFVLFYKKKWWNGSFLVVFSVAYFIVACTSFKEGDSNMEMEKIFLPLTMFAALSFVAAFRYYSGKVQLGLGVLAAGLVVTGLIIIKPSSSPYAKRIDTIQEVFVDAANKQENRKLVIGLKDIEPYPMVGCWAFGIETLVLSTIDKNMEPLTIFLDQGYSDIEGNMKEPDNFMPALFQTSMNYSRLNKYYFNLPDQPYIRWRPR
ncbi:MAG: hypothetical protein ACK5M7_19135 [Draconibacterium sp.]